MTKLDRILFFFVMLILVGHANCALRGDLYREQIVSDPSPPVDWRKIDLGYFSFYLPPDMKESAAKGIDSFVWQAVSDSARLTIDLGAHSNDLTSKTRCTLPGSSELSPNTHLLSLKHPCFAENMSARVHLR